MRLTTKGRYAVTAMLDLALHHSAGEFVRLAAIGERQDISHAYLEQLLRRLREAGLVAASKGPGGGYRLAHSAAAITVSEIVAAVGEGLDATRCGGSGDCQDGHQCLTHGLWVDLSEQIDDFLSGITLESLVVSRSIKRVARRQDSHQADDERIAARNLR